MARKKSAVLTDNELRIMEIIWEKQKVSAKEIQKCWEADEAPAYTTILTFLKILEGKGYINHTEEGRTYIYSPVVSRNEAVDSDIKNVVKRFFGNSRKKLMLNILQNENLSEDEKAQLKKIINGGEDQET